MLAVTYSIIRNKLKDYCNQATDNHETVIVTRKGRGITQLLAGKGQEHELIEAAE